MQDYTQFLRYPTTPAQGDSNFAALAMLRYSIHVHLAALEEEADLREVQRYVQEVLRNAVALKEQV